MQIICIYVADAISERYKCLLSFLDSGLWLAFQHMEMHLAYSLGWLMEKQSLWFCVLQFIFYVFFTFLCNFIFLPGEVQLIFYLHQFLTIINRPVHWSSQPIQISPEDKEGQHQNSPILRDTCLFEPWLFC